jgi:patatin-like phospholipase/acyl hydrolase
MGVPEVPPRDFEPPARSKLRILSIDGGGIRGLIPAIVLSRLEGLIRAREPDATLASKFQLISGTSTGGLIALGLATPRADGTPAMTAAEMVELYSGPDARAIFARPPLRRLPVVGRATDLFEPKYGLDGLRRVLEDRFGAASLAQALTGLLITSYDMQGRAPRFLKPWQPGADQLSAVDAGLATAAAPTYFPPLRSGDATLVDGGVFVNNPAIAATIEAMKRQEGPPVTPDDLLVVSLGTGQYERAYDPDEVAGWGALGWILPTQGEPPLISSMLDGQSDAAHHWAHILLNHEPGSVPERGVDMGSGPRYYRFQLELPEPLPMDGTGDEELERLAECGGALRDAREAELTAIAEALTDTSAPPGGQT